MATICKLDTDKFIVIYLKDASGTNVLYRVGTVSGTTITFGTEATFLTTGSTAATAYGFRADFISTNNGIAIADDGTVVGDQTVQDFRSAVLVVSLAINLVILITWIVLQLTTQYDAALLQAFLSR